MTDKEEKVEMDYCSSCGHCIIHVEASFMYQLSQLRITVMSLKLDLSKQMTNLIIVTL